MGNSDSNSRNDQVPPGDSSTNSQVDLLEVFMEGGGCKESFTAYQDCADEAEKKKECVSTKCVPMLRKCMEARSEYFHPVLAAMKAASELNMKNFQALYMPSTVGRDISEFSGEAEEVEELENVCAFMEGGGCKESFMALLDCKKNDEAECGQHFSMMMNCMHAHSDYYHPYFELRKSAEEQLRRDLEAFLIG